MTEIRINGTTTVISEVRGAEGLEKSINNMVEFMKHVKEWGLDNNSIYDDSWKTITNILIKMDFDELGFDDMKSLVEFVRVIGMDTYSSYTIAEYAYMYTKVLDDTNEG